MKKSNTSLLQNDGLQTLISSLLCILGGLIVGYVVLLLIEPKGALEAIFAVMKSFFRFAGRSRMKYFGQNLVRTVPLILCSLSVLFAYKVGMFNIGVAGQYVAGACGALYAALAWKLSWLPCLVIGMAAAALLGAIAGVLKTKCNVNVVISGIMLNWIALYLTNLILGKVKSPMSPYTLNLMGTNPKAKLPSLGLEKLFSNESSVTIAIPLAIVIAVVIYIVLNKTSFGYELKATGHNYHAAKYAGMREDRNIILTMMISGALAGLGAGLLFLTGIEDWETTISSVPAMGFNGIAVAFLGGLSPIGSILSAFFVQYISFGGGNVDLQVYCSQISSLISSLIIYLCAFVAFFKHFIQIYLRKRKEKQEAQLLKRRRREMILLLQYTLIFASVLMLVALGGCFAERSGVINIGLEGIMVIGALGGALVMKFLPVSVGVFPMVAITVLASALFGCIFSLFLAVAAINFQADQTITGTAMNMLATAGATVAVKAMNTAASNGNDVSSDIAYIHAKDLFIVRLGQFEFNWFMLVTAICLVVSYVVLYKMKFGLRLRSCGEHPQASASVGINVQKMRYAGVLISGLLGGLGGIVYITAGVSVWKFENGVAGFGFLALAVMIFGGWHPLRIALAALLFGFLRALGNVYAGFNFLMMLNIPSVVYNMLPYIISLVVLAFTSKNSRAPKAAGIPYDKGTR